MAENRGSNRTQAWLNQLAIIDAQAAPVFPLTGKDVLNLGIPTGRDVGSLLRSVEEWWISGDFKASKDECLQELKSQLELKKKI